MGYITKKKEKNDNHGPPMVVLHCNRIITRPKIIFRNLKKKKKFLTNKWPKKMFFMILPNLIIVVIFGNCNHDSGGFTTWSPSF
jgi:hypothetical protein